MARRTEDNARDGHSVADYFGGAGICAAVSGGQAPPLVWANLCSGDERVCAFHVNLFAELRLERFSLTDELNVASDRNGRGFSHGTRCASLCDLDGAERH